MSLNDYGLYPLLLMKDRMGGVYSGGEWLAFHHDPEDIIDQLEWCCAGDQGQQEFFSSENKENHWFIGRGASIQAAVDDLKRRYTEHLGTKWKEYERLKGQGYL